MISTSKSFIGSDSRIDAEPNNCSNNGTTDNDEKNLMIFRIPQNGTDSSYFEDPSGNSIKVCERTGNLVIYGWLADKGNVLPQEAWVALCGRINNGDVGKQWTILQV
jgi:hypothetical protein